MGPGLPKPGWLLEGELAGRQLLKRVEGGGIERNMGLDRGDRHVGLLVGPDGIDRALATGRNAAIGAVALVRAVGDVVRSLEQRHVEVLARDILHGWVACLTERQRLPCIGDNASCDLDDDTTRIALDRYGMVRPRDLDGLCLFGIV